MLKAAHATPAPRSTQRVRARIIRRSCSVNLSLLPIDAIAGQQRGHSPVSRHRGQSTAMGGERRSGSPSTGSGPWFSLPPLGTHPAGQRPGWMRRSLPPQTRHVPWMSMLPGQSRCGQGRGSQSLAAATQRHGGTGGQGSPTAGTASSLPVGKMHIASWQMMPTMMPSLDKVSLLPALWRRPASQWNQYFCHHISRASMIQGQGLGGGAGGGRDISPQLGQGLSRPFAVGWGPQAQRHHVAGSKVR